MKHLTKHAQKRIVARSIPEAVVELLLEYGENQRVKGADSYFFTSPCKRRLRRELGDDRYRRCERHLGIYAIVADDGRIITVARRKYRLRRR